MSDFGAVVGESAYVELVSPEAQITNVKRWNRELKFGLSDSAIASIPEPPDWPENPRSALVLVPYLDTVGRTFEKLYKALLRQLSDMYAFGHKLDTFRYAGVRSDPEHLRVMDPVTHPRNCCCWQVMELCAYFEPKDGVRIVDVQSPASPHAGVLAAMAHFPRWVQQMNGERVPHVTIPGYQLSYEGQMPWTYAVSLGMLQADRDESNPKAMQREYDKLFCTGIPVERLLKRDGIPAHAP